MLLLVTYSSQPVFETKIYGFGFDVRPALLAFETPEVRFLVFITFYAG